MKTALIATHRPPRDLFEGMSPKFLEQIQSAVRPHFNVGVRHQRMRMSDAPAAAQQSAAPPQVGM